MQNGYEPEFIGDGIRIPLPTFNRSLGQSVLRKPGLRDGRFSDHTHFTLVMNEHTRQLIYSAYNIDQSKFRPKPPDEGKRSWKKDKVIGEEHQLGNEYYKDRKNSIGETVPNPYDRGHMVMRFNNMWGDTNAESDKAGKETFVYANSSLQHENLNRDEWKELELNIVRDFQHAANGRLAVFTGPIFGDLDRHVILSDQNSARVPSGFFKVICFRNTHAVDDEPLGVLTFAIFQDDQVLRDKLGAATVKTHRPYQITITELQNLTGIHFGEELFERNPLFFFDNELRNEAVNVHTVPERIPVNTGEDLIGDAGDRRCEVEPLAQRRIIINSAMINPEGNEHRGEWISLHNRGNRKTSLRKWRLVDGQGREVVLQHSINAGESLRLKGPDRGKIRLSNAGGSLVLFDQHDCIIDHVTWSRPEVRRLGDGVAFMFDHGQ